MVIRWKQEHRNNTDEEQIFSGKTSNEALKDREKANVTNATY
jgi:hypothetical protein